MQKINFEELNQLINERQPDVDRAILKNKSSERTIRTRERDSDENKILDRLCIKKWKIAEEEGKVKYTDERVWLYDFD